jgi:hypothetical protein
MANRPTPIERLASVCRPGRGLAPRCAALSVAAIALGTASLPGYAQSSDEQAAALLRASSTQSAIITFCAHHYEIDGTTALRISKTARDVAAKVLGQEQSDAAFKDELARRYAEVKEIGEQQWCDEQRAALAQSDTPIFKN